MKSFLAIVGAVMIVNVLALLGFFGWLSASGRIDKDRVQRLRVMFQEPVIIEQDRLRREAREAAEAEAEAAANRLPDGPSVSSERLLELRVEASEIDRQRIARLAREVEDLKRTLQLERSLLDRERRAFEEERGGFEQMRSELAEAEGDEQFQKSLATIQGLKPKDSKAVLQEVYESGDVDRVVSYLNAMEERQRTKVMAEFIKDDATPLAAELLERLRVRGIEAPVAEVPSG